MRNNNKISQTGDHKWFQKVGPRYHTSNFKVMESEKPKNRDPFRVCIRLWPPALHVNIHGGDVHIAHMNCWGSFYTPPPSVFTLNKSVICIRSLSLKNFLFMCFEKCCVKLEISRVLFMVKDRFKQWGDIRLGRVSENKGNLYPVWTKNVIWKRLWVDASQSAYAPVSSLLVSSSTYALHLCFWVFDIVQVLCFALWTPEGT